MDLVDRSNCCVFKISSTRVHKKNSSKYLFLEAFCLKLSALPIISFIFSNSDK